MLMPLFGTTRKINVKNGLRRKYQEKGFLCNITNVMQITLQLIIFQ